MAINELINSIKDEIIFSEPSADEHQHAQAPTTPEIQIEKSSSPIAGDVKPPPVLLVVAPSTADDDAQSDKLSTVSSSTNSNKTQPDTSSEADKSTSSQKCKSAAPSRRMNTTLIRAHTAKSININAPIPISSYNHNHQKLNKQQTVVAAATASTASAATSGNNIATGATNERDREQGGDYLIEICGRYLNVYGVGAIKFIDRQWNAQKANDVHTFKFSYVNFNSIATILGRIKVRFPNVENFVFRETNINQLGQLNALAELQGISSLIIDPEGNLVYAKNWRPYAIYRLSHWGIKSINNQDVTEDEIQQAQQMYAGLSDLVLWSLPDALLEPLLARLRLDETCTASQMLAKNWLMQADASLKNVVGKEALQCCKRTGGAASGGHHVDDTVLRQRARQYFTFLLENTCNAVEKLQRLETMWPTFLVEMIRNTLLDYSQIDVYVKNLMSELITAQP